MTVTSSRLRTETGPGSSAAPEFRPPAKPLPVIPITRASARTGRIVFLECEAEVLRPGGAAKETLRLFSGARPATRSREPPASVYRPAGAICRAAGARWLVLHGHGVGVDCFLPGNSFQPGQQAAVVVLVCLERDAALLARIVPGQTDEVFLRFAQRQQRPNAK